jgi:hypothetical protein
MADWKNKLIIALVICSITGLISGFMAFFMLKDIVDEEYRIGIFWIAFVIGFCAPGFYKLQEIFFQGSERSKRWFRMKEGNVFEKVEKVEEKDDFKNPDWLKHQYYDLGNSIQNIADDQGVSMMTIRKWIDEIEKS